MAGCQGWIAGDEEHQNYGDPLKPVVAHANTDGNALISQLSSSSNKTTYL
jgi:hypothetical protein